MHIVQCAHCFELHNNFVFDDQIRRILANNFTLVKYLQQMLLFHQDTAFPKLNRQRILIDLFKETDPQRRAYTLGSPDDLCSDAIKLFSLLIGVHQR